MQYSGANRPDITIEKRKEKTFIEAGTRLGNIFGELPFIKKVSVKANAYSGPQKL